MFSGLPQLSVRLLADPYIFGIIWRVFPSWRRHVGSDCAHPNCHIFCVQHSLAQFALCHDGKYICKPPSSCHGIYLFSIINLWITWHFFHFFLQINVHRYLPFRIKNGANSCFISILCGISQRRRLLDTYTVSQEHNRRAMMSPMPFNVIFYWWTIFKFLVIFPTTLEREFPDTSWWKKLGLYATRNTQFRTKLHKDDTIFFSAAALFPVLLPFLFYMKFPVCKVGSLPFSKRWISYEEDKESDILWIDETTFQRTVSSFMEVARSTVLKTQGGREDKSQLETGKLSADRKHLHLSHYNALAREQKHNAISNKLSGKAEEVYIYLSIYIYIYIYMCMYVYI